MALLSCVLVLLAGLAAAEPAPTGGVSVERLGGDAALLHLAGNEGLLVPQPAHRLRLRVPYTGTKEGVGALLVLTRELRHGACTGRGRSGEVAALCSGLDEALERWGGVDSPLRRLERRTTPASNLVQADSTVDLPEYPALRADGVRRLLSEWRARPLPAMDMYTIKAAADQWSCAADIMDELDLAIRTGDQGVVPAYGPVSCRVVRELAANASLDVLSPVDCSALAVDAVYLADGHLVVNVAIDRRVAVHRFTATPLPAPRGNSSALGALPQGMPLGPFELYIADRLLRAAVLPVGDKAPGAYLPLREDATTSCWLAAVTGHPDAKPCAAREVRLDAVPIAVASGDGRWYVVTSQPSLLVVKAQRSSKPRRYGLAGRHVVQPLAGCCFAAQLGRVGNLAAIPRPETSRLVELPLTWTPPPTTASTAPPPTTASAAPPPTAAPTLPRRPSASPGDDAAAPAPTPQPQQDASPWLLVVAEVVGGLASTAVSVVAGVWLKRKLLQRSRVDHDEVELTAAPAHDTPTMFGEEGGAWVDVEL